MVKPFETKELIARVKAVLRRSEIKETANDSEISYPKLNISISNYELWLDGKLIDVPPKELELLYFLASHPNKVFTREQLLREVWGYGFTGESRTVDVHIKRIRKKIEGLDVKWKIRTVYKIGYSFEVR
jgi:DNA-binding response OmpR family regulator